MPSSSNLWCKKYDCRRSVSCRPAGPALPATPSQRSVAPSMGPEPIQGADDMLHADVSGRRAALQLDRRDHCIQAGHQQDGQRVVAGDLVQPIAVQQLRRFRHVHEGAPFLRVPACAVPAGYCAASHSWRPGESLRPRAPRCTFWLKFAAIAAVPPGAADADIPIGVVQPFTGASVRIGIPVKNEVVIWPKTVADGSPFLSFCAGDFDPRGEGGLRRIGQYFHRQCSRPDIPITLLHFHAEATG